MIGKVFERWTVVERGEDYVYPSSGKKAIRYICKCVCGVQKLVHKSHLLSRSSMSCGCLNREISSTHGLSHTRAYKSWINMIIRCNNPATGKEDTYREREATYDASWEDFENFYKDMGNCPDGFELDRLDSFGDYNKENCQWVNEQTQSANRSKFKNNTSGFTGVSKNKSNGRWKAHIYVNKKKHHGGTFDTFEEAVECRKKLEEKFLGKVKEY